VRDIRNPMQSIVYGVEYPLFSAAAQARRTDPETSKAAARSLDPSSLLSQLADAYRAAGSDGLTDEEAAARTGIEGAWKRCSDLRRDNLIAPTGRTRIGSSGRAARVCAWIGGAR
jgi:hypothetical protein